MAAIANILATSIANTTGAGLSYLFTTSTTVGADKTFSPEGPVAPGVNRWVERSGGQAINYPSYDFSFRRPIQNSRNFRIKEIIKLPVANVTSPSTGSGIQPLPSKAFELVCTREYVIPEAATLADRTLFWSYLISLSSSTVLASDSTPIDNTGSILLPAIRDLEHPY